LGPIERFEIGSKYKLMEESMSSTLRDINFTSSARFQNPMFRRVIIPWYDTEPVCYFAIIFTAGSMLFSLAGIVEANSTPVYKSYLWVPVLLFMMSLVVFSSTIVRLIRRNFERKLIG
jgi:hypothetical protein